MTEMSAGNDDLRTSGFAVAVPAPSSNGRRNRTRRRNMTVRMWQGALLGAILGSWQLVVSNKLIKPVLAKSPREVWDFMFQSARSGELFRNARATMTAVLVAFVLASIVGVAIGLTLGVLQTAERVVSPFLDAVNSMPRIALAPVFIIYFGISASAKVALAFSVVVFQIMSATQAGVRSADPDVLRLSVVLGSSKPQLFRKVLLPSTVPAIFAALRLGLIYSLLGVIASEMIAAREGLGLIISKYSGLFQLEGVYGILLVLAIIAVILNQLMARVERSILRWKPPVDR